MTDLLYSLKKFISFFFEPLSVLFILLIIILFISLCKGYKQLGPLLVFSILYLFISSYHPVSEYFIQKLESSQKPFNIIEKDIKYIVVLGGGASSTSSDIPNVHKLKNSGYQRYHESIRLLKAYPTSKVIFLGPKLKNRDYSEASIYKELALNTKIDNNRIIIVEDAKDTISEAKSVKQIVDNESLILITTAFHMKRASKIFKKHHMNPYLAPVSFGKSGEYKWSKILSISSMYKTNILLHEYIGELWLKIKYFFIKDNRSND